MAPTFPNNNAREPNAIKCFEIRPDEGNILLRGSREEASSAILKGSLVLCLSGPLRIQSIRLRFTGEKRIAFYQSGSGPNLVKHVEEVFRHSWEFKRSSETLSPGNYEWPFQLVVPGDTQESLEGLIDSWLVYRLKATIERGLLQQNHIIRKPVRIIRTLNPSDLELAHAMSVENTWVDKVDYSLSTPSKAVMFGSNIQIDFTLIPLLKNLRIGKVTSELIQKQSLTIRNPRSPNRVNRHSYPVAKDTFHPTEESSMVDIGGQDGFTITRLLPVPKSLRCCVQDFEGLGIKIRHHLAFNIQMHNPDGHVSELHANLPIFIFISPHLPIDEEHNLVSSVDQPTTATVSRLAELTPPQYGEHVLDQLYSDIDPNTYVASNGPSGVSTPVTARSRSVSYDDLNPLAMTSIDATAQALQARLNNIDSSGGPAGSHLTARERAQPLTNGGGTANRDFGHGISPPNSCPTATDYFQDRHSSSADHTPGESVSRHSSGEDITHDSPQHVEFSIEDLSKVPSYTTAMHTNPRRPLNAGLPSYQAATGSSMPWALSQQSLRTA